MVRLWLYANACARLNVTLKVNGQNKKTEGELGAAILSKRPTLSALKGRKVGRK